MTERIPHIIVHAGFHRTGTTSVQVFLDQNAEALSPHIQVLRRRDFQALAQSTRRYTLGRFRPVQRWRLVRDLRKTLARITPDHRPILLSWEGFSGTVPGWGKVTDYRTAAPLAGRIARELTRRFGAKARITFAYSTRDPAAWRKSAHAHLIKYHPLTEPFQTFARRVDPGFDTALQRIQAAIAPATLHTSPLEDLRDRPLGPAELILDLIDMPREGLNPVDAHNQSACAADVEAMRKLNASDIDPDTLRQTKRPSLRETKAS